VQVFSRVGLYLSHCACAVHIITRES